MRISINMTKCAAMATVAAALTLGGVGQARADFSVLASGIEMGSTIQSDLAARGISLTIVDPSTFSSQSFAGYNAIWLGWSTNFSGLASRQSDILSFVTAGGNFFGETGGGNVGIDGPLASQLTRTGVGGNQVHIVDASNPVDAGLTDAGLSNWSSSYHDTYSSIGSFTGLTQGVDAGHTWVTVTQQYGAGWITYTGQDPDYHIKYGAGATGPFSPKADFIVNALEAPPLLTSAPEPASLTLLGVGTVGLMGYAGLRRRRAKAACAA